MAEIVNLRRARKTKTRQSAEATAEANRLRFGRTKSERQATEIEHNRAQRHIEGHRLQSVPGAPKDYDSGSDRSPDANSSRDDTP
jgi:hypothetical protein